MTTDNFTNAAHAEAKRVFSDGVTRAYNATMKETRGGFIAGAEWARARLAAHEPTDAEVLAALNAHEWVFWRDQPESDLSAFMGDQVAAMRAALTAARKAR